MASTGSSLWIRRGFCSQNSLKKVSVLTGEIKLSKRPLGLSRFKGEGPPAASSFTCLQGTGPSSFPSPAGFTFFGIVVFKTRQWGNANLPKRRKHSWLGVPVSVSEDLIHTTCMTIRPLCELFLSQGHFYQNKIQPEANTISSKIWFSLKHYADHIFTERKACFSCTQALSRGIHHLSEGIIIPN